MLFTFSFVCFSLVVWGGYQIGIFFTYLRELCEAIFDKLGMQVVAVIPLLAMRAFVAACPVFFGNLFQDPPIGQVAEHARLGDDDPKPQDDMSWGSMFVRLVMGRPVTASGLVVTFATSVMHYLIHQGVA